MGEDITRLIRPEPPSLGNLQELNEDELRGALEKVVRHLQDLALYDNKVNDTISSDFIVRGSQVQGLTVDDLLEADHIIAEVIQVGTETDRLTIDRTPRIRVYDGNRHRVTLGKEGSEYGIWIRDADGTLILSASGLGINTVGNEQIRDGSIHAAALGDDVVLGSIDSIEDINSAGDGTIHTYGSVNANAPTTSPGTLVTHGNIQYATSYETGRTYKRTRSAGIWGPWVDITTGTAQLPPIASAISDPDSAANGSFHVLSVGSPPGGIDVNGETVVQFQGFQEGILSTVENEIEDEVNGVFVAVGDKIQTFRDYFSGRLFTRKQSNGIWQPWEEVTMIKNIVSTIHLQARLITADKLDITSTHKFVADVRMEHSDVSEIWKFQGFDPGEGIVTLSSYEYPA